MRVDVINPKRAEALSDGIRLHVAVVVLTRPNKSAIPLQCRSDHVVDQAVFIRDAGLFILRFEFLIVDFLENVFEAAVVLFQKIVRVLVDR